MTFKPNHYVTLHSDTGLVVRVPLGDSPATLSNGVGGWEIIDRPKRSSITRYKGKQPFNLDIPVLFDGTTPPVTGQEVAISKLTRMGISSGRFKDPPVITLAGAVPRTDLKWVIQNLSWDNQATRWKMMNGVPVRIRQAVTINLLQYVDEGPLIQTPPSPAVVAGGGDSGAKIKNGSGKNAKQEAQDEYGNASLFQAIFDANPWMLPDPRSPIPAGTIFVVPPKGQSQSSKISKGGST
jgi:hypothetical protein